MLSFTWRSNSLKHDSKKTRLSRRALFGTVGKASAASVVFSAQLKSAIMGFGEADAVSAPVAGSAGVDRITVLGSRTYLHGWAGYGEAPVLGRPPVK
jgi:hypothetical protein